MSFLDPKYDTVSPYEEKIMEAEAKAFNEARDELIAKFLAEGRKKDAKRLKKATEPRGLFSWLLLSILFFFAYIVGMFVLYIIVGLLSIRMPVYVALLLVLIAFIALKTWYNKKHPADEEQEWARLLIRNYMLEKSGKPIDGSDKSSRYSVFKR